MKLKVPETGAFMGQVLSPEAGNKKNLQSLTRSDSLLRCPDESHCVAICVG